MQVLHARGHRVGRKRVIRLMRAEGLRARPPRRFVVTTDSRHQWTPAPDRLRRRFHVRRPNRYWVADLTYLDTADGWAYLAVVESFFSTLKQEIGLRRWATHDAAARDVAAYIDGFYNPVRLHSTLGYQAPATFEAAGVM